MKSLTYLIALSCLLSVSFSSSKKTDYEIAAIYNQAKPIQGAKVIEGENAKDIKLLLVPTTPKAGNYKVHVTRVASDIYKVDEANIYVETRYCYEYSYGQEVILDVEYSNGYTLGKLTF